jgi:hypothetical protein
VALDADSKVQWSTRKVTFASQLLVVQMLRKEAQMLQKENQIISRDLESIVKEFKKSVEDFRDCAKQEIPNLIS